MSDKNKGKGRKVEAAVVRAMLRRMREVVFTAPKAKTVAVVLKVYREERAK